MSSRQQLCSGAHHLIASLILNNLRAAGSIAFTSGASAAVGSSFVKVPIAVCIRSVQAGVYKNVFHAAKTITSAVGVRGLFTVSVCVCVCVFRCVCVGACAFLFF